MKTYAVFVGCILVLSGCADLTVKNMQVVWSEEMKVAVAEIANMGLRTSNATTAYFDGDENPESPNYRPQVQADVTPLRRGESLTRVANFAPLARPENAYLRNVYGITLRVDPKNTIRESNEGNNTRHVALLGSTYTCIDFDSIAVGTVYGTPAGQAPGTLVIAQSGVKITVENFRFTGGGGAFNHARIDPASAQFGTGHILRTNNINLDFDFTGVAGLVHQLVFKFADFGGFENLAVDGQPIPIYAGELMSAPSPLGGSIVTSVATAIPSGKRGTVAVVNPASAISHIRVGGQEFFLDDVCFR